MSSADDSCADEVVTFFASGKQLQSYRTTDLVSRRRETVYRFWQFVTGVENTILTGDEARSWRLAEKFDASALTYKLNTVHGDSYVFDVRSGAVQSANKPFRTTITVLGVVLGIPLILLIVVIVGAMVKRKA